MSACGASLVAAAVRAAILANAPRRAVQAVASAVAGVALRPDADPRSGPRHAGTPTDHVSPAGDAPPPPGSSPEELLEALRASRRAQRARKKARRRASRSSRGTPCSGAPSQTQAAPGLRQAGAADNDSNTGGVSAVVQWGLWIFAADTSSFSTTWYFTSSRKRRGCPAC